ncbi:MAG: urea carboxylase-associated family protein [Pseudomonadota bacterium]
MSDSHPGAMRTIPGAHASAFSLNNQQCLKVVNTEGSQVVDCWAFCQADLNEFLSNEHTRSCLEKLIPSVGDSLYSNARRPILTLVEDTSPGIHDLLLSACDPQRYALLGCKEYHRNCQDNLREAMQAIGLEAPEVPSPFNIFENVSVDANGGLAIEPPVVSEGEYVTLRAEQDIVVVLSCCPMDIALTNGPDLRSKPVDVHILA